MPKNFLEGCPAAEAICEDIDGLTPDELDQIITSVSLPEEGATEEDLKAFQEATNADSLVVISAADVADNCEVCPSLDACKLGKAIVTATT